MSFLYGFIGAVLGAVIGIAAAFLAVAAGSDGNDFADGFALMGLMPVGLVLGGVLGVVAALWLRRYVKEHQQDTRAKRKNALIVAGSVAAAPLIVTALFWGVQQARKPPSDQQLLRNFDSHHAVFSELA